MHLPEVQKTLDRCIANINPLPHHLQRLPFTASPAIWCPFTTSPAIWCPFTASPAIWCPFTASPAYLSNELPEWWPMCTCTPSTCTPRSSCVMSPLPLVQTTSHEIIKTACSQEWLYHGHALRDPQPLRKFEDSLSVHLPFPLLCLPSTSPPKTVSNSSWSLIVIIKITHKLNRCVFLTLLTTLTHTD